MEREGAIADEEAVVDMTFAHLIPDIRIPLPANTLLLLRRFGWVGRVNNVQQEEPVKKKQNNQDEKPGENDKQNSEMMISIHVETSGEENCLFIPRILFHDHQDTPSSED